MRPTVNKNLEKIQKLLGKLKWLRSGKILSKDAFPFLPTTHQEALRRKYRVALRLVHRAPFVGADVLLTFTREQPLDNYVKRYIAKRLKKMCFSDLGSSIFLEDVFLWDKFHKEANNGVGRLFILKRVKRLKLKHRSLLLDWLAFNDQGIVEA